MTNQTLSDLRFEERVDIFRRAIAVIDSLAVNQDRHLIPPAIMLATNEAETEEEPAANSGQCLIPPAILSK